LLNPGPVTLSPRVRNALLQEDMCHREPDFAELMLDIKSRLCRVYAEAEHVFDAIVLTGSGTAAVEAMVATLAPRDAKTLVVSNGVYGERIAAMLQVRDRSYAEIRSGWLEPMDLERVERLLKEDVAITHVIAVHTETTTGRLNEVSVLADLCAEQGKSLMLDAVSSFGAEAIDFSHPALTAVASTSNKCLHGIVGSAFVVVRNSIFEQNASQAESLYLDLFAYHQAQRSGYSPFTQAVHSCFALREALLELEQSGGWEARRERYLHLAGRIRGALAQHGVPLILEQGEYSSMISSFALPRGWDYPRLHDTLRSAGFVIYAGQGGLFHDMFRICNMGDIHDEDADRLLANVAVLLA
jgi:2-aminoethylphosphonate-pyruvate transaminase